jgi:iron complex outermembrane receptor protein
MFKYYFLIQSSCLFCTLTFLPFSALAEDDEKLDELVVSASPIAQSSLDSAQSVTIINKDQILTSNNSSLGATLQNELGVTSTSFSQGASRPVIRGLGGDRVRILENGIGTNDVSNSSPDHPVSTETLNASKIEIVRGPAALMFGTTAVGGVVNVLNNRIATSLPESIVEGDLQLRSGTVDKERTMASSVTTAIDNVAVHLEASARKSDDYKIPGFARTNAKREEATLEFPEPNGTLSFSQNQSTNVALGTSYIFNSGYIGIAGSLLNNDYGVPNGEENISIDSRTPRLELRGKLNDPMPYFESVFLNAGISNYQHTEFEGEEVGTVFKNKASDSRVELKHQPLFGKVSGVLGFQGQTSRFSALGEEAYQPETDTNIGSVFLFEEVPVSEQIKFQAGLRSDNQSTDAVGYKGLGSDSLQNISRDFNTFSQSSGLVYTPVKNYSLALSLARTERAPVGQELFANGPHIATGAFEIGNPDLNPERSVGVDLTARKADGFVSGSIGGFMNRFTDYIGLNPNGLIEDDLPVYNFESQNATFYGIESQVAFHFLGQNDVQKASNDLTWFSQQDWVWAKDRDTDEALPRIPPFRVKTGIRYQRENTGAQIDIMHAFAQNRTVDFETDTSAYTFLNAQITHDLEIQSHSVELFVRGENLLNDEARNHVSFIKDLAPLPGRNIMGGLRFNF